MCGQSLVIAVQLMQDHRAGGCNLRVGRALLQEVECIERVAKPLLLIEGRRQLALHFNRLKSEAQGSAQELLGLHECTGLESDYAEKRRSTWLILVLAQMLDDLLRSRVVMVLVNLDRSGRETGISS